MTSTGGYNPIRWDCERQGCWNAACRPPIHFFHDCFPRKISMSDIDATVELNGHFLFLEWKSVDSDLPVGQAKYFRQLTRNPNITSIVVFAPGNPNAVEKIMVVRGGDFNSWEDCSLEDLHRRVRKWASRVDIKLVGAA